MSEKDELQNNGAEPQESQNLENSVELPVSEFPENTAVEYDSFEDEDKDFLFPIDEIVEPPQKGKKKKKKKKKKKSKFRTVVYIIVLVCLAVLFGWLGYVGAYLYPMFIGATEEEQPTPIKEQQQEAFDAGQLTVLLMGSDKREGDATSRSDTLMVAFVDLYEKEIRLLSMPRDTYITIPGTGEQTKLNHAYAYGGVELAKQTLRENFGIDCEYYMDVDFQGFIDIVDALGGVTVNVPKDMYYPDEGIDLKAGVQELDGNKALQFCRFRNDPKGDLGRIERQQAFLMALKESMFSAGAFLKIPELCTAVVENVDTDFTGTQILQIAMAFKDGVNFETYQPDCIADYLDEVSYVFVTDNGQALIDALVAFAPIPENINVATNTLDVTVSESEEVAAPSDSEESETDETTTEEETTP